VNACNAGAVVTVQGTGGTPNYTYAFVNDSAAPLRTDYTPVLIPAVRLPSLISYDVWVLMNGCTFKLDISVVIDALQPL
jgi:hypothetical protein